MKEDEARTKWCPMARVAGADGSTGNRDFQTANGHPAYRCIGSDCMMWQSWSYHDGTEVIRKGEGDCGLKFKDPRL